jgi:hypothetical protein
MAAGLAADEKWARLTPDERRAATEPARKAAEDRYLLRARELHPDADPAFLAKVATSLRSAHYRRMALNSAKSRQKATRRTWTWDPAVPYQALPPDLSRGRTPSWRLCMHKYGSHSCSRPLYHTGRHAAGTGDRIVAVWA